MDLAIQNILNTKGTMQTHLLLRFTNAAKMLIHIVGLVSLGATWYTCWMWFALITEGWLVPWDTTPMRPPVGTRERTINDFFEIPPGAYLPATLFLATNVALFAMRFRSATNKTWLPLLFAMTNVIFLGTAILFGILARVSPDLWLSQPRPPLDVGFHRTWFAILIIAILVGVLFTVQAKMSVSGWNTQGSKRE